MNMRRRDLHLLLGITAAALLPLSSVFAAASGLPVTNSIIDDLTAALKVSKPLVVMVSLDGCSFCKIARENYLIPLMREQAVPVVQVDMRKSTPITDALGRLTTHDQLTRAWGIKVAPTVLFLGKNGQEVAERLVGASTSDFYGVYLQERVTKALQVIKAI